MIINRLKAENFGIFGEGIEVEFSESEKIGIFGRNETGKSTLFRAIETCLFGLRRGGGSPEQSRENLVTWGKEKAKLSLKFTSGGKDYLIEREIGAKRGHEAVLYPIVDGSRASPIEDNVTQVDKRVEEITGMDRNSFTKLIYIKQKELDALKELGGKSKREELVNKVMGMEEFDRADDEIRQDVKDLKEDIKLLKERYSQLEDKKEEYENKKEEKQELEDELEELNEKIEEESEKLEEIEKRFNKLDWLHEMEEVREHLKDNRKNKENIEEKQKDLEKHREKKKNNQETLKNLKALEDKHKDTYELLQERKGKIENIKKNLENLTEKLEGHQKEKEELIETSDFSKEEIEELPEDISSKKSTYEKYYLISGAVGLMMIFLAFFYIITVAFGTVAFYFAYRYRKKYSHLEDITASHNNFLTIQEKIKDVEKEMEEKRENINENLGDSDSLEKIEEKIEKIEEKIESKANVDSFDKLEEKIKNIQEQQEEIKEKIEELEEQSLDEELEKIKKRIKELEEEKSELEEEKPSGAEEIEYSEKKYEKTKENKEDQNKKFNNLKNEFEGQKGELKQVKKRIEELEGVEEDFEKVEDNLENRKYEKRVLNRARDELGETSRTLRKEVIPHAEVLINNILPTLTNSRYHKLDIEEDLTFRVYSNEAGQEKDKNIFSGGTQDQFLIALRLAFTQSILNSRVRADQYCLLMDECISSSDESRKKGIFEIMDMMGDTFQQMLVIAHEDISQDVDEYMMLDRNEKGYTTIDKRSW